MDISFEFKTKISDFDISLEINASEKHIERIEITSGKQINDKPGVARLSKNDLNRLPHLYKLINLLDDYFSGKIVDFIELPINFSFYPDFSGKILKTLRNIKYGETLSYKELAVKTGYNEKYSRACATALSINKTPIILPCHRITASGGKLGGWSGGGGIKLKAALLSLEQNNFS
ncbi:MAG: methylated-DNA--[protein]-cysteine S-methyltransferase [bacterium]